MSILCILVKCKNKMENKTAVGKSPLLMLRFKVPVSRLFRYPLGAGDTTIFTLDKPQLHG